MASYYSTLCAAGVLSGIPSLNVAQPHALAPVTAGKELDFLDMVGRRWRKKVEDEG